MSWILRGLSLNLKNSYRFVIKKYYHASAFFQSYHSDTDGSQGKYDVKDFTWKRLKKNDPELEHFLSSSHIKSRISNLSQKMGCSVEEATELVKRDSPLALTDTHNLHKRIQILTDNNFTTQDIISNPAVLRRRSEVLQSRLSKLRQLKQRPDQLSLSVLKKSHIDFKMFLNKCVEKDRLFSKHHSIEDNLCHLLDCSAESARRLIEVNGLNSVSFLLLKKKINLLQDYGISNDEIQNLIKTLMNCSNQLLVNRLNYMKDRHLLDFAKSKLGHLFLCKDNEFIKSVQNIEENYQSLEGFAGKEEYLIFRLKCSKKVAEGLANSKPIHSMSEMKLKKMLDIFLNDMQMTSNFIVSNVHLMGYSVQRMKRRWAQVQQKPTYMLSRLLAMSDEQFQKFSKTE